MSLFVSTLDIVATGLELTGGTAVLTAPILYLTAPTLTDSGRSRVGLELLRTAVGVRNRRQTLNET